MSKGGPAPAKPATKTVDEARKASEEAAKKGEGSVGASILTSGAGILDDAELRKNVLGATPYTGASKLG